LDGFPKRRGQVCVWVTDRRRAEEREKAEDGSRTGGQCHSAY